MIKLSARRVLFFCLLFLAIVVGVVAVPFSHSHAEQGVTPSPAIWGTNLGLFNGSDPFFSTGYRAEMSAIHVRAVRMPIRGNVPSATEIAAMQNIKAMGATPVVIMHGATDATFVPDDIAIVKVVASVFGTLPTYIEMGNEEDLAGIGVGTYTADWNMVVPQVQPLDPTARFGGPVNFQYNGAYIHAFITGAIPKPAFISWHEYTCSTEASGTCITNIAHWASHMSDYHTYTSIPVLITEYNYSPFEGTSDSAFLQQWMTTAMEQWVSLGVAGAFQYRVDQGGNNGTAGLISVSTNNPLPEGQVFASEYQKYFGTSPMPTPSPSPTMPPPPPPVANGVQQQFQAAWNQGPLPSSGPLYIASRNLALTRHLIVGTPIRSFPSFDWGGKALTYTEFTSGMHAEMHADKVVRIYMINTQVYP